MVVFSVVVVVLAAAAATMLLKQPLAVRTDHVVWRQRLLSLVVSLSFTNCLIFLFVFFLL